MSNKNNDHLQGSKYDKIFRENMRENLPGLMENVLSLDLTTLEDLQDDIQYTKERETDLLKKVKDAAGNVFILHVEFQRKNDRNNMVYRMAEYSVMLQRRHRLPVLQYVVYIGKGKATMLTHIDTKDLQFRYNLTALSGIDHKLFLASDKIEEKMLAILANLDDQSPKLVLKQILLDIKDGSGDELSEGRYIKQLRVLVQLRNLEQDLKEVMETTGRIFKIEKDPFYIEGKEKGIELERSKALQEKIEIARSFKSMGVVITDIAKGTGLAISEIEQL